MLFRWACNLLTPRINIQHILSNILVNEQQGLNSTLYSTSNRYMMKAVVFFNDKSSGTSFT